MLGLPAVAPKIRPWQKSRMSINEFDFDSIRLASCIARPKTNMVVYMYQIDRKKWRDWAKAGFQNLLYSLAVRNRALTA
jgi:hypothetical protein